MDFFEEQKQIEPILSVSEFIEYVNLVIGRKKVTVEGEIASYSVNQNKWVFFDLKDAASKISCFALVYQITTPLEDGMQIRVKGVPRVYQKSGKFSIFVESVELAGSGSLKRAFELTKAKLEKEGLFSESRKRSIVQFPKSVGLIASRESAAYTDFIRILNGRWGGVEIVLYHCMVQGQGAEKSLVQAFDWFNREGKNRGIDTLVLIRGGGSLEDLQPFNSEAVARAIFGSTIPVVCGVGHERDITLADLVADVRAATPTHAASLVVPDRQEMQMQVSSLGKTLNSSLSHLYEWHAQRIMNHYLSLNRTYDLFFQQCNHVFSRLGMVSVSLQTMIHRMRERVASYERNLEHLNPVHILKRGYSMVMKDKKIIVSIHDISKSDKIDITLSDGSVRAEIL